MSMDRDRTVEELLREYARWRHEPGYQYMESPPNTLERARTDRRNPPPGTGNSGPAFVMVDDGNGPPVMAPPDGGLGDKIDRWARAIERDKRALFIRDLQQRLRAEEPEVYATFAAIYHGNWYAPIRSERGAAEELGITRHELRERRPAVYAWFSERLITTRCAA